MNVNKGLNRSLEDSGWGIYYGIFMYTYNAFLSPLHLLPSPFLFHGALSSSQLVYLLRPPPTSVFLMTQWASLGFLTGFWVSGYSSEPRHRTSGYTTEEIINSPQWQLTDHGYLGGGWVSWPLPLIYHCLSIGLREGGCSRTLLSLVWVLSC